MKTPMERATEIVVKAYRNPDFDPACQTEAIIAAINAAVADERESCAMTAEAYYGYAKGDAANRIADVIRSRK